MMLIYMKDTAGRQIGEVELDDTVFAAPVNRGLMHQALVRQLSNARLGTHKTKTRSEVSGGGRKPWRQKGTGRARQGSTRAPNWVGGGIVFGPQPRKYKKAMPKKMRRAALRSALSVRASADEIVVIDKLSMAEAKTREFVRLLDALALAGQSVLLLWSEQDHELQRSANNLPYVKTLHAGYLNIRDLLGFDTILVEKSTVDYITDWLALAQDDGMMDESSDVEEEFGEDEEA